MECWLVTDNEFNRNWNASLIGQYFQFAPSYCIVEAATTDSKKVWLNIAEYRQAN